MHERKNHQLMPYLWGAAFSSSSSSSSYNSVRKGGKSFGWSFKSSSSASSKRRLTRQRKLRHVTDDEIGLRLPQSMPVSPDYGGARSQYRWTKSAVPQPLPLPDVNCYMNKHGNDNLPLPIEGSNKFDGDRSISAITRSNEQTLVNSPDDTTRKSQRTPTYQRRGFFQGLNVEGFKPVFRVNVPARSAPGSGFSSPILSPQRFSTVDLFQSSQRASVSEASPLDMVSDSSHTSISKVSASRDHSPSDSPNIWYRNSIQHSHHKSITENNVSRHDSNNANLHPLPLPPGISRQLQSCNTHRHIDKSETPTVKGQWQKGKLIGRGTFGSVYEATHRETGALCAMKEVDFIPDDPKCAESIKQLEQEIKVLRQLKHPNIVQYYGSEIIGDRFCIYLEYVHPGSINKYAREHCGAMTECIVRNFTRHILSGLAYLHSTKTIHRDIKGANLLVNASGVVKLADFGLAKHLTGTAINLSLKGSPHWMAPEVLQAAMRNDSKPDHACAIDLWSLGCTVIEMLTGKPPWGEFDGVQAMFNVLNKTPCIPDTLSLEGKDFLKKCLQREPTDRPSAVELLDHPFLHNIRDPHVSIKFSGIRLLGTPNSTRDSTKHNHDHVMHERLPSNGEISARPSPGHSDFRAALCYSPRSTLEILPCISSPELNGSSSYANALDAHNGLIAKAETNPLSLRNHERQILHF